MLINILIIIIGILFFVMSTALIINSIKELKENKKSLIDWIIICDVTINILAVLLLLLYWYKGE